jgi:nitrilase
MSQVALLQFNAGAQVQENLDRLAIYVEQTARAKVKLLVLPENFAQMRTSKQTLHSEVQGGGLVQDWLKDQARKYKLWILAGSLPLYDKGAQLTKPYSRSLLIDAEGNVAAQYNKIHLFDVDVPGSIRYRESDDFAYGATSEQNIVSVGTPLGDLGLSICYDLRFPELFRQLASKGARIIAVPAAFTAQTGEVHWETLLRSRAIENSVYILGCGQVGVHANGRATWGHSMVIDPWGEIIAQQTDQEGLVFASLDLIKQDQLRKTFPSLEHRRLD